MNTPARSGDELMDALLTSSRVLIGIAAKSVAEAAADITLVQYRALVVLAYQGQQRITDLAGEVGVNSSTATRLVHRLVRKELAHRFTSEQDRRATCVEITDSGALLVAHVTAKRRREFTRIVHKMSPTDRNRLAKGLQALNTAAGEPGETAWSLGWR